MDSIWQLGSDFTDDLPPAITFLPVDMLQHFILIVRGLVDLSEFGMGMVEVRVGDLEVPNTDLNILAAFKNLLAPDQPLATRTAVGWLEIRCVIVGEIL